MGRKHIYTCDVEIFKTIDNQDKAYWLGFLLGNGHITKHNHLKLELSNLLYDNFECSSYLERKYNKTKDFLKEIYSS